MPHYASRLQHLSLTHSGVDVVDMVVEEEDTVADVEGMVEVEDMVEEEVDMEEGEADMVEDEEDEEDMAEDEEDTEEDEEVDMADLLKWSLTLMMKLFFKWFKINKKNELIAVG